MIINIVYDKITIFIFCNIMYYFDEDNKTGWSEG